VWRGRRSNYLLGALITIAVANGFFLGFTIYGLIAALVTADGTGFTPLYAILIGGMSANYLLVVSIQRERQLRQGEYELWTPLPIGAEEHPLVARLRGLASQTSLTRPPTLACIESPEKNAFTVGRSQVEASIVLTTGLMDGLTRAELDAVMAQQLAHVENDDVKTAGLADAIADSIADLARIKGRFLWGPGAILKDLRPVLLAGAATTVVLAIAPSLEDENNVLLALLLLGMVFWVFYALWQAVKMSWRGLGQLLLFTTFLGPLSFVEAVLGPPTAALLSKLVSRARVHEADERAISLCGDREALVSALQHVEGVEADGTSPWLGERRYSLFVAPRPKESWWPWLSRQQATHPSIESRIETIRGDRVVTT
jgi:Zn-dependent protease with chaperone function